jgi:hypothetical protein
LPGVYGGIFLPDSSRSSPGQFRDGIPAVAFAGKSATMRQVFVAAMPHFTQITSIQQITP